MTTEYNVGADKTYTTISGAVAAVYTDEGATAFTDHRRINVDAGTYTENVVLNQDFISSEKYPLTIRGVDETAPVINGYLHLGDGSYTNLKNQLIICDNFDINVPVFQYGMVCPARRHAYVSRVKISNPSGGQRVAYTYYTYARFIDCELYGNDYASLKNTYGSVYMNRCKLHSIAAEAFDIGGYATLYAANTIINGAGVGLVAQQNSIIALLNNTIIGRTNYPVYINTTSMNSTQLFLTGCILYSPSGAAAVYTKDTGLIDSNPPQTFYERADLFLENVSGSARRGNRFEDNVFSTGAGAPATINGTTDLSINDLNNLYGRGGNTASAATFESLTWGDAGYAKPTSGTTIEHPGFDLFDTDANGITMKAPTVIAGAVQLTSRDVGEDDVLASEGGNYDDSNLTEANVKDGVDFGLSQTGTFDNATDPNYVIASEGGNWRDGNLDEGNVKLGVEYAIDSTGTFDNAADPDDVISTAGGNWDIGNILDTDAVKNTVEYGLGFIGTYVPEGFQLITLSITDYVATIGGAHEDQAVHLIAMKDTRWHSVGWRVGDGDITIPSTQLAEGTYAARAIAYSSPGAVSDAAAFTIADDTIAHSVNANWIRWINASINKHFNTHKDSDLPMYTEGDLRDLTQQRTYQKFFDLRVDGPYYTQTDRGYWDIYIEINALITVPYNNQDLYRIHKVTDHVASMFANSIPTYRLGSGAFDDQTLLGCLTRKSGYREKLQVSMLGTPPNGEVLQSVVEGHYTMTLAEE